MALLGADVESDVRVVRLALVAQQAALRAALGLHDELCFGQEEVPLSGTRLLRLAEDAPSGLVAPGLRGLDLLEVSGAALGSQIPAQKSRSSTACSAMTFRKRRSSRVSWILFHSESGSSPFRARAPSMEMPSLRSPVPCLVTETTVRTRIWAAFSSWSSMALSSVTPFFPRMPSA